VSISGLEQNRDRQNAETTPPVTRPHTARYPTHSNSCAGLGRAQVETNNATRYRRWN